MFKTVVATVCNHRSGIAMDDFILKELLPSFISLDHGSLVLVVVVVVLMAQQRSICRHPDEV